MALSSVGRAAVSQPEPKPAAWSEDDVSRLIKLREEGHTNAEIATRLGRPENAIAIKATRLRLPPKGITAEQQLLRSNPKAKYRPCLTCQTTFFSEGPGHRICNGCKSSSMWSTGSYSLIGGGRF